jgi:hypothetical protein
MIRTIFHCYDAERISRFEIVKYKDAPFYDILIMEPNNLGDLKIKGIFQMQQNDLKELKSFIEQILDERI